MFNVNIDRFPKCVLFYLLSYCRESYKSLRVVCRRFALLVPMPPVRYHEFKILQPKKMILNKNSGTNYPNSLEIISIEYNDYDNILDFKHLTNLREINGQRSESESRISRNEISIKVPDNLKILTFHCLCDLSNTKLEKLSNYDDKTIETAPSTLKKLFTERLYPFCKKFVNLELLYLSASTRFDISCFTKLKKVYFHFDEPCKLPLSMEHIIIRAKESDLDFTYLPNLKTVKIGFIPKHRIKVNSGVKLL